MFYDDVAEKTRTKAMAAMLKQTAIRLDIHNTGNVTFDSIYQRHNIDTFMMGDRSLDPFGSRYLSKVYGSKSLDNVSSTGSAALDKEIQDMSRTVDLDRHTARATRSNAGNSPSTASSRSSAARPSTPSRRSSPTSARVSSPPRSRRPSAGPSDHQRPSAGC
ncbi:hypothetical protein ABT275_36955 [Streptomyces sp. NPDC001185]|uniref:hypothetical protein n=1 Tax=Streptomyces sp. NPDC001185 TaxID=3154380 RepID=UPI003318109B